jgi:hypothetical protein
MSLLFFNFVFRAVSANIEISGNILADTQSALITAQYTDPPNKALRIRLDLLLGHFLVLRGENRRGAELADLSCRLLPKQEGTTPCYMAMLCISNGKTNKFGKKQYGGVLRHRDPLLCTISALAMYFFYRWHTSKEPTPTFRERKDWYNTKVLVGSDPDKPIAFRQQFDDIRSLFTDLSIVSEMVTHAPRKGGAQSAEFHCVPGEDVSFAS